MWSSHFLQVPVFRCCIQIENTTLDISLQMLQNPQDFIITGYYPPPYFYCSRTLPDEFGQIIKIEVISNKREIESKVFSY